MEVCRNSTKTLLVAYLIGALIVFPSCAPNRSERMQQAARQQASVATGGIGNPQEVRRQAADASSLLDKLSATVQSHMPQGPQQPVAQQFVIDSLEISSGLRAIADSQTDPQFTNAVFAMCDSVRVQAAPRLGRVMLGMAGSLTSNPSTQMTEQQRQQAAAYFSTFGHRLMNIPVQCQQSSSSMAAASAQEQQDEIDHKANVNNALTAAAVVFAGTVLFASTVGAAAATRPPVTYQNQTNNYNMY
jgi:hypothetical protein